MVSLSGLSRYIRPPLNRSPIVIRRSSKCSRQRSRPARGTARTFILSPPILQQIGPWLRRFYGSRGRQPISNLAKQCRAVAPTEGTLSELVQDLHADDPAGRVATSN